LKNMKGKLNILRGELGPLKHGRVIAEFTPEIGPFVTGFQYKKIFYGNSK
jgi:hypothetical protein